MKKTILSLAGLAAMTFSAVATPILNDPFNYSDGSLITVSGGTWVTHSGATAGQVDVAAGVVNLSQTESEDVNAPLSGNPFSSGVLYFSMAVNFSTLPSGNGGYFIHLKDSGISNFRARIFAATNGAASGTFRLGIANGSTPAMVATDLALGTEYKVVVRYDTATATSTTIQVNPASEGDTSNLATATDTTTAVGIVGLALRQSSGMGILTVDDVKVGTTFADVASSNPALNPPSISVIANQSIAANTSTPSIPFTIADGETAPSSLVISSNSSNPTLIPNSNISITGTDGSRNVTITPAAGQQGVATITITVTDSDNNVANRNFTVTVGAPTISTVPNQMTQVDVPTSAIAFTVGDAETAAGSLTVSGISGNTTLVPNDSANITFGGSGANRTVTITPAAGQSGIATITLSVNDGTQSVSTSFIVTVSPSLGVILEDTFSYPEGSIQGANSGFIWNAHNGGTNETQVIGGKLFLTTNQTEDINAFLTGSPYAPAGGFVFYSKFTINFTALPSSTNSGGEYFAHFRDTGTGNQFKARVFAGTNGAAPGTYRLGIANGGAQASAQVATDLNLNTTYTVVTRYNVGVPGSTLWVNPVSESSPSVTAIDSATASTINTYAFRQSTNFGSVYIDDLKIGTAFSDVVGAVVTPPTLAVAKSGANVVLTWSDPTYALQAAPLVTGTYTTIPGATSPYTNAISGTQQYFRLVK